MKASIVIPKGKEIVSLLIEPVSFGMGIHRIKVLRADIEGRLRIATFFLDSEGHCFELLRQLTPKMGYASALTTSAVMDALIKNKIEELYNE